MIGGILKGLFPTGGAQKVQLEHDSLLHVLEARRGRGKSYLLTELMIRMIGRRVPIVTNTTAVDLYRVALVLVRRGHWSSVLEVLEWCAVNVRFAKTWDDLLLSHNSVVILDEATRLFDGRKGLGVSLPSIVFEWLKQSRKMGLSVYFVAHSVEWLDKRVTQILDMYWQVRKVAHPRRRAPDGTPYPLKFYAYGLDPGGVGRVENVNRARADWVVEVPFNVRVAQCYESQGLIHEIAGECHYNTVSEIAAELESRGVMLNVDGEQLLHAHRERLGGGALSGARSPQGVRVPEMQPA